MMTLRDRLALVFEGPLRAHDTMGRALGMTEAANAILAHPALAALPDLVDAAVAYDVQDRDMSAGHMEEWTTANSELAAAVDRWLEGTP